MPQLDPTWFASQIFWLAIAFVTLYVVLARWALPRVQAVMTQRGETLSFDKSRARECALEADRARQTYERALSEARENSQRLFAEAALASKAANDKAVQDMDRQASAKLAEARRKITARKQQLIEELTPLSQELAAMIVEKLSAASPSANGSHGSVDAETLKSRRG